MNGWGRLLAQNGAQMLSKRALLVAGMIGLAGGSVLSWTLSGEDGGEAHLTPTSTVEEFRGSSSLAQASWLEKMCDDGACLAPADWRCGFSFTSARPEELTTPEGRETQHHDIRRRRDCFVDLASKAPREDTLDKLRILCGRRHMVFIGDRDYKPADCAAAGGEWGKKSTLFSDESRYFEK